MMKNPIEVQNEFLEGLEAQGLELAKADDITELKKIVGGDKPYYEFKYQGVEIKGITIEQMNNYKLFTNVIAEKADKILPAMPASVLQLHHNFLNEIWEKLDVVHIGKLPDDTFETIRSFFMQWLKEQSDGFVNARSNDEPITRLPDASADRKVFLLGLPCLFKGGVNNEIGKFICFTIKKFRPYLLDTSRTYFKMKDIIDALKVYGAKIGFIKVGTKTARVYYFPYKDEYFTSDAK